MFSLRTLTRLALFLSFLLLILPLFELQAAGRIDNRYELEIHNHSEVVIYNVYMSHSYETQWGRDRLEDDTLSPRHYISIEDIVPGEYDFLVIDEYGRKCMQRDYPIFNDKQWDITDEWLDQCKRRR